MADLNVFSFTGRLTGDASYRTTPNGKGVLTMNVAVNTGYGDYKRTLFIKVQQWGEKGQNLVQYLKKGNLVGGTGEMSRSEWTTRNGEQRVDFVVDVMAVQMLGQKKQEEQAPAPAPDISEFPEEIPF